MRWLSVNGLLDPTLTDQLKAGTRIVSTMVPGSMKDWEVEEVDRFTNAQGELSPGVDFQRYESGDS